MALEKILCKINTKRLTIVFCLLLVLLLLIGFLGDKNSYFIGNLVPELTGVCIEALLALLVIDKWHDFEQKKRLITLERRLREYLIFFLKHNFKDLPNDLRVTKFHGAEHQKNIVDIDKIIKHIREHGLTEHEVISIQNHCTLENDTFSNLLPVASELTNEHFKAWCRIVYFVNCISQRIEPVGKSTVDILQNIKKFDTASFDEKLYVGAAGEQ